MKVEVEKTVVSKPQYVITLTSEEAEQLKTFIGPISVPKLYQLHKDCNLTESESRRCYETVYELFCKLFD